MLLNCGVTTNRLYLSRLLLRRPSLHRVKWKLQGILSRPSHLISAPYQRVLDSRNMLADSMEVKVAERGNYQVALLDSEDMTAPIQTSLISSIISLLKSHGERNAVSLGTDTLALLHHCSAVFHEQEGAYDKARHLYSDCWKLRMAILGPRHPSTLESLSNLAEIYALQNKQDQALRLHEKCYEMRLSLLGTNHPSTLQSLDNLAMTHEGMGSYVKALPLYEKIFAVKLETFGFYHPQTIASLNNVAVVYSLQLDYDKAEPLFEKCLRLRRELLGQNHPDTLSSLSNLAHLYILQAEYTKAKPLHQLYFQLKESSD